MQQKEARASLRNKMAEEKKQKIKHEEKAEEESSEVQNLEMKKKEEKPEVKKVEKQKKYEACVNITSAPISTRHSVALCDFIRWKKIEKAIEGLEEVASKRKALPMKGEFAHKKGMMSGKYPQNSTRYFIKALKSLQANANFSDVREPIITEAIANLAPRPRGRFGRYQRKRTHITIVAKELKNKKEKHKEKN